MTILVRVCSGFALAMLLVGATDASAALITFNSRAAFDLAAPGLPVEDFEEANVAAGSTATFTGALNSTTNNAVFGPGEILAGFSLEATDNVLVALGNGFFSFPTVNVGPNFFSADSNLRFTNASAVGFDLHTNITSNMTISVFGEGDVLLSSFVIGVASGSTATFFGVINDSGLITRLNVNAVNDGAGEVFDNVAFGAAVPEPSTVLLIGGGLLAVAARRRLQKRS